MRIDLARAFAHALVDRNGVAVDVATHVPHREGDLRDHHAHAHLTDFFAAYHFVRSRKTLCGLTPYEYICMVWTSEPYRFILDLIHQMPGLHN